MFGDDFSFKFPELDVNFKDIDIIEHDKSTLDKINRYLDEDMQHQDFLISRLLEFERKLDLTYS